MNRKPRARPAQLRARTVARKTSRPDTSGAKVLGSKTSRQAMPRSKVARGSKRPKSAREKVKAYRERMRRRGMKLIQIWVRARRTSQRRRAGNHDRSPKVCKRKTIRRSLIPSRIGTGSEAGRDLERGWGARMLGQAATHLIIQDNRFSETNSVTLCGFTSSVIEAPFERPLIEPSAENGLRSASFLMVDKIMTVQRSKLGHKIGRLDQQDALRLNSHLKAFLGLV